MTLREGIPGLLVTVLVFTTVVLLVFHELVTSLWRFKPASMHWGSREARARVTSSDSD